MQPIGNRLVQSMLAAGANVKLALVRFFRKNELRYRNCFFIQPIFYSFLSTLNITSKD